MHSGVRRLSRCEWCERLGSERDFCNFACGWKSINVYLKVHLPDCLSASLYVSVSVLGVSPSGAGLCLDDGAIPARLYSQASISRPTELKILVTRPR